MIFKIFPAENAFYGIGIPFMAILTALCLFVILLFLNIFYVSRNAQFIVTDKGLRIKSTFLYSRIIPYSIMKKDEIRPINLKEDKDWQPVWRSNGIGLPGYQEGWFRMKNGSRALLFLTNREKVILIPTVKDYSILISTIDNEGLQKALKEKIL
jgi:hypothetical protein